VPWELSFAPEGEFLSILWKKEKNLNFGQISLNLTQCAAPQAGIEPGNPGHDSTLQAFGLSAAVWFIIATPENCPRD